MAIDKHWHCHVCIQSAYLKVDGTGYHRLEPIYRLLPLLYRSQLHCIRLSKARIHQVDPRISTHLSFVIEVEVQAFKLILKLQASSLDAL